MMETSTDSRLPAHVPHLGGYLVAGALSVVLFAAFSTAAVALTESGSSLSQWAWIALVFGGIGAVVPGTPLAVLAHHLLRQIPSEAVHVATFAAVGAVTATAVMAVFHLFPTQSGWWTLLGSTALATAMSRFAVGRAGLTWRG